ncbi:ABC transporter permease subunit, partial [Planctomycetota bacterium]
MRPYLAVIKDSFREALASRVLWIMLLLIAVFLGAIAPFGWEETLAHQVFPSDIRRVDEFTTKLARLTTETNATDANLRAYLDDELLKKPDSRRQRIHQRNQLAEKLTEAIKNEDLFSPDAFDKIEFNEEGETLRRLGNKRTPEQTQRLNRLAIGTLYSRYIKRAPDGSVAFHWAGFELDVPPLPKKMAAEIVETTVNVIIQLVAGSAGVFACVLLTASIIPNTFDAGSIYLLLSKPISRPLLYLAKFMGGCSFVLIIASLVIVGVWLISGFRFDLWNHRLLYCIPIFLFLFSIYYSVSGFAGLVWRNTIVCVGIAIMFWAFCWGLGVAKNIIDIAFHVPNRVAIVTSNPNGTFSLSNNGAIRVWDGDQSDWKDIVQPAFAGPGGPMLSQVKFVLPTYDREHDRTILVRDKNQLCVMSKDIIGNADVYDSLPSTVTKIIREADDRLLLIGEDEAYRISADLAKQQQVEQPKIFGFSLPKLPETKTNFEVVSIERKPSTDSRNGGAAQPIAVDDADIAGNVQRDSLVIWKDNEVIECKRDEGRYVESTRFAVEIGNQKAVITSYGQIVAIAVEDGSIRLMEIDNPSNVTEFQPFKANQPRSIQCSRDGRFVAVLFHSGQVWLYDTHENIDVSDKLHHQENILGMGFSDSTNQTTFMIVDRINRVTEFSLPDLEFSSTKSSSGSIVQKVSWFALDPLTKICPQPSSLGSTVDYAITGKTSAN